MKNYVADFETTTPKDHDSIDWNNIETRVWGYGITEIGDNNSFQYGNNIYDFMEWCKEENKIVYFHNLKFDGSFILNYLYINGYKYSNEKTDKTFNTIISAMGTFYEIEVIFKKYSRKYKRVVFRDSLKKLPFKVAEIAKGFKLPILKGDIDYKKERPFGYEPDEKEIAYMRNDVEIVSMALHSQFESGLTKMTNASDALHEFKMIMGEGSLKIGKLRFESTFPVLPLGVDRQIRDSYRGGFTYCSPSYAGKDIGEGLVFDVNSMYPWALYHCPLPYGRPKGFDGEYKMDDVFNLYVQRVYCTFTLKENHIPTIQLKHNSRFSQTEYITTTYDKIKNVDEPVWLTLTNVDLELFFEHYDVDVWQYGGGLKFRSHVGFFNDYIDKWMKVKEDNTFDPENPDKDISPAMRLFAKLMLNSLYGKFGKNPDVTGKIPVWDKKKNRIKYVKADEDIDKPIYVALASFVTSYARDRIIRSAQKIYPRFIYADTDSLHIWGKDIPEGLDIHPSKLGMWNHESTFSRGRFIRAKTYIEEIDNKLHVTCAGMPDGVKDKVTWDNFHINFQASGKLLPRQVFGGALLKDTVFTMK